MKVGFIGLGVMGSRMAANLMKKGNELVVYNRTREKAEPLVSKGAIFAESPAKVAGQAAVLITMLTDPHAVDAVASGRDGFLEGMGRGSLWIDCSTVNPSLSREMAKKCAGRGVRFVDAPLAGSKIPAEQGQLIFFAGGKKEDVEFVRPLLEAMGKAVFHVGGHGMGTAMKMVNNLLLGGSIAVFSEAMVLGEELGIRRDMLFDALLSSPVTAPIVGMKSAMIESGDFEAHFPLRLMHKDLHLASVTAYECGVAMPSSSAVKEAFSLAMREGLGEKDMAVLYQYLKQRQEEGL